MRVPPVIVLSILLFSFALAYAQFGSGGSIETDQLVSASSEQADECGTCTYLDLPESLMFPTRDDIKKEFEVILVYRDEDAEIENREPAKYAPIIVHIKETDDLLRIYTDENGKGHFSYIPYEQECREFEFIYCHTPAGCGFGECLVGAGIDPDAKGISTLWDISLADGATDPGSPPEPIALRPVSAKSNYCPPPPTAFAMPPFCLPLMLLFALLGGSLYMSGRNPFSAFDFSAPRMHKPFQYAARTRGMSMSMAAIAGAVGSVVSFAKTAGKGELKSTQAKLDADAKKAKEKKFQIFSGSTPVSVGGGGKGIFSSFKDLAASIRGFKAGMADRAKAKVGLVQLAGRGPAKGGKGKGAPQAQKPGQSPKSSAAAIKEMMSGTSPALKKMLGNVGGTLVGGKVSEEKPGQKMTAAGPVTPKGQGPKTGLASDLGRAMFTGTALGAIKELFTDKDSKSRGIVGSIFGSFSIILYRSSFAQILDGLDKIYGGKQGDFISKLTIMSVERAETTLNKLGEKKTIKTKEGKFIVYFDKDKGWTVNGISGKELDTKKLPKEVQGAIKDGNTQAHKALYSLRLAGEERMAKLAEKSEEQKGKLSDKLDSPQAQKYFEKKYDDAKAKGDKGGMKLYGDLSGKGESLKGKSDEFKANAKLDAFNKLMGNKTETGDFAKALPKTSGAINEIRSEIQQTNKLNAKENQLYNHTENMRSELVKANDRMESKGLDSNGLRVSNQITQGLTEVAAAHLTLATIEGVPRVQMTAGGAVAVGGEPVTAKHVVNLDTPAEVKTKDGTFIVSTNSQTGNTQTVKMGSQIDTSKAPAEVQQVVKEGLAQGDVKIIETKQGTFVVSLDQQNKPVVAKAETAAPNNTPKEVQNVVEVRTQLGKLPDVLNDLNFTATYATAVAMAYNDGKQDLIRHIDKEALASLGGSPSSAPGIVETAAGEGPGLRFGSPMPSGATTVERLDNAKAAQENMGQIVSLFQAARAPQEGETRQQIPADFVTDFVKGVSNESLTASQREAAGVLANTAITGSTLGILNNATLSNIQNAFDAVVNPKATEAQRTQAEFTARNTSEVVQQTANVAQVEARLTDIMKHAESEAWFPRAPDKEDVRTDLGQYAHAESRISEAETRINGAEGIIRFSEQHPDAITPAQLQDARNELKTANAELKVATAQRDQAERKLDAYMPNMASLNDMDAGKRVMEDLKGAGVELYRAANAEDQAKKSLTYSQQAIDAATSPQSAPNLKIVAQEYIQETAASAAIGDRVSALMQDIQSVPIREEVANAKNKEARDEAIAKIPDPVVREQLRTSFAEQEYRQQNAGQAEAAFQASQELSRMGVRPASQSEEIQRVPANVAVSLPERQMTQNVVDTTALSIKAENTTETLIQQIPNADSRAQLLTALYQGDKERIGTLIAEIPDDKTREQLQTALIQQGQAAQKATEAQETRQALNEAKTLLVNSPEVTPAQRAIVDTFAGAVVSRIYADARVETLTQSVPEEIRNEIETTKQRKEQAAAAVDHIETTMKEHPAAFTEEDLHAARTNYADAEKAFDAATQKMPNDKREKFQTAIEQQERAQTIETYTRETFQHHQEAFAERLQLESEKPGKDASKVDVKKYENDLVQAREREERAADVFHSVQTTSAIYHDPNTKPEDRQAAEDLLGAAMVHMRAEKQFADLENKTVSPENRLEINVQLSDAAEHRNPAREDFNNLKTAVDIRHDNKAKPEDRQAADEFLDARRTRVQTEQMVALVEGQIKHGENKDADKQLDEMRTQQEEAKQKEQEALSKILAARKAAEQQPAVAKK